MNKKELSIAVLITIATMGFITLITSHPKSTNPSMIKQDISQSQPNNQPPQGPQSPQPPANPDEQPTDPNAQMNQSPVTPEQNMQLPQQTTKQNTPDYNQNDEYKQYEILDKAYKREIIGKSPSNTYTLENMKSIVGPKELAAFISKNDMSPAIYTPSNDNTRNGTFRANFHIHTTNSDGTLTINELLDQAEAYAESIHKTFYLAITDHNTVEGLKTAVDIIQKNPQRYKNIRLVLGIEVFSSLPPNSSITRKPIDIHVLCWCINPYDYDLNTAFIKKNPADKYNFSYRTFDNAVSLLKSKGIVGIAHPMRYITNDALLVNKGAYFDYLINKYISLNWGNVLFSEGYYQSYTEDEKEWVNAVNAKFKQKGVIRTGSTDSHGRSIFQR